MARKKATGKKKKPVTKKTAKAKKTSVKKKTAGRKKATAGRKATAPKKKKSAGGKKAAKKTASAKKTSSRKKAAAKKKTRKTASAGKSKAVEKKRKTAAKQKKGAAAKEAGKDKKHSVAVEKLMALKDKKSRKSSSDRGFLIRAPKRKGKKNDTASTGRFTRRILPSAPAVTGGGKAAKRRRKKVLRKRELEELRSALTDERKRLIEHLNHLDEAASLRGPSEVNQDVPGYSIHLAEYASDNQTVETSLMQRAMQYERLSEIEEALERIDQPGYGLCQTCGSQIGIERLKVKPFAAMCVHCRELKEQGRL